MNKTKLKSYTPQARKDGFALQLPPSPNFIDV